MNKVYSTPLIKFLEPTETRYRLRFDPESHTEGGFDFVKVYEGSFGRLLFARSGKAWSDVVVVVYNSFYLAIFI